VLTTSGLTSQGAANAHAIGWRSSSVSPRSRFRRRSWAHCAAAARAAWLAVDSPACIDLSPGRPLSRHLLLHTHQSRGRIDYSVRFRGAGSRGLLGRGRAVLSNARRMPWRAVSG